MTNNRILILALLITGTYTLSAQEVLRLYCPHPELNEDSCGYINSRKELVIPVGKYQRIYSLFFDKIAFVSLKGKKGIYAINRSEEILFEVFNIDNGPDYTTEGLFRIIADGKIGFANMDGKIIIKPQFVFPFPSNGMAVFNTGGTLIHDGEHSYYQGGRWGIIDKSGKIIVPANYEDGKNAQLKQNGKWYNMNEIIK